MKWQLCSDYCLYDPENPAYLNTCSDCLHSKDYIFDPPRDGIMTFGNKTEAVTVIAANGNLFYVQTIMSSGQPSIATVDRDRVKLI